jgi:two-component system, cell cycle sensor histidine kinase and response regulator CckA
MSLALPTDAEDPATGPETSQREADNQRAEDANYRSLVDNLPLVIYSRTLEADTYASRALYMNGQVEAVLDLPAHEAQPGRVRDMIHPDDLARVGPAYDEANRLAQPLSIDYRLITALGRTVWVHDEARVVFDDAGRPLHAQGYLLDITAQRLAEIETAEALVREQTARLEAEATREEIIKTVESMSDAFFSFDRDLRILYVNVSGAAMLEHTPAQLVGNVLWDVLPDAAAGPTPIALQSALEGVSGEYEQYYAPLDMTIEFRAHPSPEGVWVFARDVSARRRLEDSLRQSQKLEAVGQLTGGIAHDFNNIVTAIMGYSEFALRDLSEGRDRERIQSEIEAIQTAGERARELTQQLLAFSRQQVLQPRVLDLSDVVVKTERLLHRLIGENIQITTSTVPDLARVKCDATQIEQVLMNLAVNARDAMPDGGTLTIETANVELSPSEAGRFGLEAGQYVTLGVADTGHGIPDEIRGQIFEPFFTTKDVGHGTGLGLATVHGIVHQSKGGIQLESGPHGTTVRAYFPVSTEDYVCPETCDRRATPVGTERVLLVEDEPVLLRMTTEMLRRQGFEVISAPDPVVALEVASSERFDVVVTDVVMPKMSGAELADRIAETFPKTRFVFISGYTHAVMDEAGLGPTKRFLPKPFSSAELIDAVRGVLDAVSP